MSRVNCIAAHPSLRAELERNGKVSTPGNSCGVNSNTGRSANLSVLEEVRSRSARFRTFGPRVSYFSEASRVSSVAVTF
jgi:hypothetical protein